MSSKKFSILISTKNRINDLFYSLNKMRFLIEREDVLVTIYDDGSTDETCQIVKKEFPNIQLLRNEVSKGYLFCRNKMLNDTQTQFAISLDDDAHFLTANALELIENHFKIDTNCGLIAFRLFWSLNDPKNICTNQLAQRVKGFVGCGHVWRIKAWHEIPNYPEWFEFYGEEEFAALQLYKKGWEVHYLPQILVQHRVDLKLRTIVDKDFGIRYRRSLRAGWYLFFLFYPKSKIPRMFIYSIYMQFKTKILRGNFKVIIPIFQALLDLIIQFPKCVKNRNELTIDEYTKYRELNETKIYWKPEI